MRRRTSRSQFSDQLEERKQWKLKTYKLIPLTDPNPWKSCSRAPVLWFENHCSRLFRTAWIFGWLDENVRLSLVCTP